MRAGQIVFGDLMGVVQCAVQSVVQYRIPLFQRTYDWGETQWERLWEDLSDIYEMDEPRTHFIGSVVTQAAPPPIAGLGVSQYVLIDGQQRMTTLLILLSAIRDNARQEPNKWDKLADEIQDLYLVNRYKHGDEKPKLVLSKRDRAPFIAIVEGETPRADSRVGQAWRYFNAKLSAGDASGGAIDLAKLKNCVSNCLVMVSITLDDVDSPNRIFESLNNTGLPLNAADLIRNYTFMNIRDADKQDSAYENHWYPMQESLDSHQEIFFWHYLMVDGNLPNQEMGTIFNGIKAEIGGALDDNSIIEALRRFHEFSNYYLQVVDPNQYGEHEQVSLQINRIHNWELNTSYSFLMKALSYVKSGDIDPSELAKVAAMIESFVIRRYCQGYNQSGLRDLFVSMSANVDFENNFVESSRERLMNWRRGWPNNDRFISGLMSVRLYVPSRLARARLILDTLERALSGKEKTDLSDGNITIEHIMPQKLTNEWRDALGPDANEVHSRWIDTLGNLTLTGYNSELGNMPFSDKKAILAESKFSLSESIKDLDEWNAETIEQRGRELAKLAAKLWPR